MKIPNVFMPEKDLENKIGELNKKNKNLSSKSAKKLNYNQFDCRVIYNRAKKIAENLGELDIPFTIYNFEDEKTGMMIEYAPHWGRASHVRIDIKEKNSFPIVFEAVQYKDSKRQKVSKYVPGEWQDRLREIGKKI